MLSRYRIPINCGAAVLLTFIVLQVLGTLEAYIIVWTSGGVPSFLSSIGWANKATFFLYDVFRFFTYSFFIVWPLSMLRPRRPVIYSLVVMAALFVMLRYWQSGSPPLFYAIYSTSLKFAQLLSVPILFWLVTRWQTQHNKSFKQEASDAGSS